MARSPSARMRAWDRFTAFSRRESRCRRRCRLNGVRTLPPACWVAAVGERQQSARVNESTKLWVRAAVRS